MVGPKKKTKICEKGSQEDWISKLPDHLICDILSHLPTNNAIRTSYLSTRWKTLWQWVLVLDLDSCGFSKTDAFVSFVDRSFHSYHNSWIQKLRLNIDDEAYDATSSHLRSWIVAATRIQNLDVGFEYPYYADVMPLNIYTCQTLVNLRLSCLVLADAECVSLPCLKIMHLKGIASPNQATLEKLISGSPVLEDLTIFTCEVVGAKVLQVRSRTLKKIDIDENTQLVIDAPLLQCLRTKFFTTKNFKMINSGFPAKLDIGAAFSPLLNSKSVIRDILTDILKIRDLVISGVLWKVICLYSESIPLLHLSRLKARFSISNLDMLPTLLESCPKLEFLILELGKNNSWCSKDREPNVVFSKCLGVWYHRSSLWNGNVRSPSVKKNGASKIFSEEFNNTGEVKARYLLHEKGNVWLPHRTRRNTKML